MKRLAVLTSGGDAPGMNACIRAVVRKGIYHGFDVFGVERGYEGVIDGLFRPMGLNSVAGIIQHGGTMLKTARSERFTTEEGFAAAIRQLRELAVDALIVIGGDGSMAGAARLAAAKVPTVVIPATIDNDMPGTEYTIGFDTALNTVLEAVNRIRDTAASHERVAVVEVMGRSAGHIALMAGLACGAEAILLPEHPADMDDICKGLKQSHQRGKLYSIVMVAEGAGKGFDVAAQIAERTGFKPHVTVLGYIQRGGSPSAFDNIMGSRMGALAVDTVIQGNVNRLIAYQQGQLVAVPYEQAFANKRGIDLALYELASILAI
ncbi:6-phosphofructokinase [Thermosinus carboxydivorans Nor1]|uniref:ATP-dependent 6-phosphofructokinase n=1 Tax=Thermosinus carboxydivorans Nor1 TaxID=401526 RepID=A1HQ05_9FIRM|nr:6-phosphofructokinase [Thermosinus carboxydivorans]EAX47856.1 6-phosphofructokinase [Thermosinus carboxydivorans Nor1]